MLFKKQRSRIQWEGNMEPFKTPKPHLSRGYELYESRMTSGWTLQLLKLAATGSKRKKGYFTINIRLVMSILLDIKLQGEMMGALGVRNKVRSSILYSNSFTWLGPVISLFPLPKLNALKHFPSPPPSSRLRTYPSPSAILILPPMFKEKKGRQCPKFPPIYLQTYYTFTYIHIHMYTHIHIYIYIKYLYILPSHLRRKVFSSFLSLMPPFVFWISFWIYMPSLSFLIYSYD